MAIQKLFEVNLSPGDAGDPYIAFLGADGRILSSRDTPMRCTDVLIGYHSYSARTPPFQSVTTTKIGDCHATADFVFGFGKVETVSSDWHGIAVDGRWFSAGGTFVAAMHASGSNSRCNTFLAYTFMIDSGEVFLEEQAVVSQYANSGGSFVNVPAYDVHYHLYCCSFD